METEDEYSHWQHEWCDDCTYGPTVIVPEPWNDTYRVSRTAWGNWHIVGVMNSLDERISISQRPRYLWRRLLVRK